MSTEDYVSGMMDMAGRIMGSGLANADNWLIDALGGGRSTAGVRVGYHAAMTCAYVWAATNIISSDVAGMPLDIMLREADGDNVPQDRSPAYWLLNHDANDWTSGYLMRETLTHHALIHGNGYAQIHRDAAGSPMALELIEPNKLTPEIDGGQLWYVWRGTRDRMPGRDVLHIRGLGGDAISGHSWLQIARNSVGLALAQDEHGSKHFANGAAPGVILKHPRTLSKEQADELLEAWEKRHQGAENTNRPALAAGGLEVTMMPVNNKDAEWLESRKFTPIEIAAWFQMPPHKLGDSSKVAYNSIEAENRAYLTQTLQRWTRRWEAEVDRKLIAPRNRRSHFSRHNPSRLLESDMETKAGIAQQLVAAMIWDRNEARQYTGKQNARPDQEFLNPNTTTGGGAEETPAEAPETPQTSAAAAHRQLVRHTVGRLVSAMQVASTNACSKPHEFNRFVDAFSARWTVTMSEALTPVLAACAEVPGLSVTCTPQEATAGIVGHCAASLLDAAGMGGAAELSGYVADIMRPWETLAATAAETWIEVA